MSSKSNESILGFRDVLKTSFNEVLQESIKIKESKEDIVLVKQIPKAQFSLRQKNDAAC